MKQRPQYQFVFSDSTRTFDVYRAPASWWARLRSGAPQLGREEYHQLSLLLRDGHGDAAQAFLAPRGLFGVLGQTMEGR